MLFRFIFVVIPLTELAILIYLGNLLGGLNTILIVVITGLLGAFLAKRQGLATLSKIRDNIERGIPPGSDILHAALILIGGLLLLTPGVITDLVGLSLLIPQTRKLASNALSAFILSKIRQRNIRSQRIR